MQYPLNLGFSGGKDSVVILDLAERSGIKYNAIYANTTVDPPGTISFIKKNYPQVQIMHPEKSFFRLIEEKGFPSRLRRFCCEKLKELGIFEKWQANTDAHTAGMYGRYRFEKDYVESRKRRRRNTFLDAYAYLSDAIESSFIFVKAPEGPSYWREIVDQLREEI